MSWSTTRIYAAATTRAIDWLRAEGVSFYHLQPPDVPVPIVATPSELVPGKHRDEFSAWAGTAALDDPENARLVLPANAEVYGTFPDREELLGMKWLAERIQGAVAIYSAQTWGGSTEYEWCWEFGRNERVLMNAEHSERREEAYRDKLFRRKVRETHRLWRAIYEIRGGKCSVQEVGRDESAVLARMLESFGVRTTGFFKPHMREFDWSRYRVEPGSSPLPNRGL